MQQGDAKEVPGDADGESQPDPHARSPLVAPLHGHEADAVATPAGEMNDLGIEHDALDALTREKIPRDGATKALEATLRVRHPTRDPGGGEGVKDPAKGAPVERLARPSVAAVGENPAAQGKIMGREGVHQQRDLIGRGGKVCIGEDKELPGASQHPRAHSSPLAAVGDLKQA